MDHDVAKEMKRLEIEDKINCEFVETADVC